MGGRAARCCDCGGSGRRRRRRSSALRLDAAHTRTLRSLAYVALGQGSAGIAAEYAERAVQLAPHDAWGVGDLAFVQYCQGRDADALATAAHALELDGDNPSALATKARVLVDYAEHRPARALLQQVAERDPGHAEVRMLCAVLWLLDQPERALRSIEEALTLRPGDPLMLFWLGEVRAQLGRDDAADAYRAAVEGIARWRDLDGATLRVAAMAHLGLREYDACVQTAFKAVTRGLLRERDVVAAHFDIGLAMLCLGHSEFGVRQYELTIERARAMPPLLARGALIEARLALARRARVHPALREPESRIRTVTRALKRAIPAQIDEEVVGAARAAPEAAGG